MATLVLEIMLRVAACLLANLTVDSMLKWIDDEYLVIGLVKCLTAEL